MDSQSTDDRLQHPSASNSSMCAPSEPFTLHLEPSELGFNSSSDTDSTGPITGENRPFPMNDGVELESNTDSTPTSFSRFVQLIHKDVAYISRSPSPVSLNNAGDAAVISSREILAQEKRLFFRRRPMVQTLQSVPRHVPVRQWSAPFSPVQQQTFVSPPSPRPSIRAKAKGLRLARSKSSVPTTPKNVDGELASGTGGIQRFPRPLFRKVRSSNVVIPEMPPPTFQVHRASQPRALVLCPSGNPDSMTRSMDLSASKPSLHPTPPFPSTAAVVTSSRRPSLLQQAKSVVLPRPNLPPYGRPVSIAVSSPGTGLVSQHGGLGGNDEKTVDQRGSSMLRGPTGTIKAFKSSNRLSSSPSTLDSVKTTIHTSSLPPAFSVPILPTATLTSSHAIPSASHSMSMWEYEVEVRPRKPRPKSFVGKLFAHAD